ncbi:MAG: HEAT repeat domain-containing protein, partial [Pseudomonadota bacterium]
KAVKDPDKRIRKEALLSAMVYREKPEIIMAPLLVSLNDRDVSIKLFALRVARGLGAKGGEVVPKVIALTKESDMKVRTSAIETLGTYAPASDETLQALADLFGDRDVTIRKSAFSALQQIGSREPKRVIPIIGKAAESEPNANVKQSMVTSLSKLTKQISGRPTDEPGHAAAPPSTPN